MLLFFGEIYKTILKLAYKTLGIVEMSKIQVRAALAETIERNGMDGKYHNNQY